MLEGRKAPASISSCCGSFTACPSSPHTQHCLPQINSDPYGEGWMVKVKLSNPDELKALLDAKAYEEFCA